MKAKKHLGQNFLKSEAALRKIVEAGEVGPDDTVLEIGPGQGALTTRLLERAGAVIAVEKDQELVGFLKEKFQKEIGSGKLNLVSGDILDFETSEHGLDRYKIIANIPYNITGAILKKFLTAKNQPERMVLMVQHEVAQRIVARDGKESVLSISVKAYGEPRLIFKVPARYFSPAPQVDSAIIAITGISRRLFTENGIPEENFWETVKKGFIHKRKKVSSNLKIALNLNKKELLASFGDKRPENLTLADWILLAK